MKKTFCFKSIFPGSKKWAYESGFAWLQAKMAMLTFSSGLSDLNFAKFVIIF